MFTQQKVMILIVVSLIVSGCTLRVVNVKAPDINYVFDSSGRVTGDDTVATIPIPVSGTSSLQTRTYVGSPGAPAEGLYAYEYRIDLRDATGIVHIPAIRSLRINFGPIVRSLDYNGDGRPDDVYVITSGGLGSIGLRSAKRKGDTIKFTFDPAVAAGGRPGTGESSFFFGLVSTKPPKFSTATVTEARAGRRYDVQVRTPDF